MEGKITMETHKVSRRCFMKGLTAASFATMISGKVSAAEGKDETKRKSGKKPAQTVFPRWRGFNVQYFFTKNRYSEPVEDDFRWTADWGFNFIRVPMSYRVWTEDGDVYKIKKAPFERIDRIVDWGRKYKIHISLNLHRGPGYCINRGETEPFNLWQDTEALDAFCFHWELFAKRYRGLPSSQVSFDLINEPRAAHEDYERVVRAATKKIRAIDPKRLVIADGLQVGTEPVPGLVDLGVGQSCRGYAPGGISHYRASWVDRKGTFPEPIWPDKEGKTHRWDRQRLEEHYQKWANLARQGVGVHCGECGCYNKTPHDVFLAWFRDVLDILTGHNIGYALWNLRGAFGVVDSGRKDADYEDFHGHKLDKKLFAMLMEF